MEHSALHALQLCGMVIALGGPILMLGVFFPACRKLAYADSPTEFSSKLESTVTRWVFYGALFGAIASLLNLFVDVAELKNQTIFGGASPATVWRFATVTTVGHLSIARIAALLLTALAVRFGERFKWWLAFAFALAASVFASLVCHAAAQPTGRATAIAVELTHIIAASIWLGGLIHLLFARRAIESASSAAEVNLVAEIVKRFSPVALAAVILIAISGIVAAVRYLVTPSAVPTSAYGLTLMVKLTLLIPLLYAGHVNYKIVRPALLAFGVPPSGGSDRLKPELQTVLQRFGKMLELEVTAGVLVIAVAGILASVSPPGEEGKLRLTGVQTHALFATAHWPQTQIANPDTFYGANERTVDDLRYAEFTHNWSGIAVCLLGLCWLTQSLAGGRKPWVEKLWPLALIPFGIFIAVAADPEVWILRKVSLAQAFVDPALIEHQIGALLVFILAWLGWRDGKRPAAKRPLGYALPVLIAARPRALRAHGHAGTHQPRQRPACLLRDVRIVCRFGPLASIARTFSRPQRSCNVAGLRSRAGIVHDVLLQGSGLSELVTNVQADAEKPDERDVVLHS